uniref:NADH-ubiquinone oxidoreductase chain 3 n=1 Tax=Eysarcoris guttigerus TaxID=702485 RepID=A0A6G8QSX9_EYSGU|nr:NADH dehydrogenase subunit 3 [Eysarcoris guttigerus]QIN90463.1 NADH dehydrogenase subunit 3 [Eysarcoris guttigerus]
MMYVSITIILAIIIALTMMLLCTLISKSSKINQEKLSPFECGFDPKSSARTPFSIQFFLIAILFLIFDIEIAIMLPIILTMKISMNTLWTSIIMMFIIILILGLYHEWNNGVLEWAN